MPDINTWMKQRMGARQDVNSWMRQRMSQEQPPARQPLSQRVYEAGFASAGNPLYFAAAMASPRFRQGMGDVANRVFNALQFLPTYARQTGKRAFPPAVARMPVVGALAGFAALHPLAPVIPSVRRAQQQGLAATIADIGAGRPAAENIEYHISQGMAPLPAFGLGLLEDLMTDPLTFFMIGKGASAASGLRRLAVQGMKEASTSAVPDLARALIPARQMGYRLGRLGYLPERMEALAQTPMEQMRGWQQKAWVQNINATYQVIANQVPGRQGVEVARRAVGAAARAGADQAAIDISPHFGMGLTPSRFMPLARGPEITEAIQAGIERLPQGMRGYVQRPYDILQKGFSTGVRGPAIMQAQGEYGRRVRAMKYQKDLEAIDIYRRLGLDIPTRPSGTFLTEAIVHQRMPVEQFQADIAARFANPGEEGVLPFRTGLSADAFRSLSTAEDWAGAKHQVFENKLRLAALARTNNRHVANALQRDPWLRSVIPAAYRDAKKLQEALLLEDPLDLTQKGVYGEVLDRLTRGVNTSWYDRWGRRKLPVPLIEVMRHYVLQEADILDVFSEQGLARGYLPEARAGYVPNLMPRVESPADLDDRMMAKIKAIIQRERGIPTAPQKAKNILQILKSAGPALAERWDKATDALVSAERRAIRQMGLAKMKQLAPGTPPLTKQQRADALRLIREEQDAREAFIREARKEIAPEYDDALAWVWAQAEEHGDLADDLRLVAQAGGWDVKAGETGRLPGWINPTPEAVGAPEIPFQGPQPGFAKRQRYGPLKGYYHGLPTDFDALEMLIARTEMEHSAQARQLLGEAGITFGVPEQLAVINPKYARWLTIDQAADRAGLRAPGKSYITWPELQGLRFDPDTAHMLVSSHSEFIRDPFMRETMGVWLRYMRSWRAGATVARPVWAIINMHGNLYNNFLRGLTNPVRYVEAAAVSTENEGLSRVLGAVASRMPGTVLKRDRGDFFFDFPIGRISLRELHQLATDSGWRSGWSRTEVQRAEVSRASEIAKLLQTKGNPFHPNFVGYFGQRTFSIWSEDVSRIGLGIHGLANGQTPEEASRLLARSLFDYTDRTAFERGWLMQSIAPFWTWVKNNTRLQLEMIASYPGWASIVPRMLINSQHLIPPEKRVDRKLLPRWMQETTTYQTPWYDEKGNPIFAVFQLPFGDLNRFKDIGAVLDMAGPFKLPMEAGANFSFWRRQPIDRRRLWAPPEADIRDETWVNAPWWIAAAPRSFFFGGRVVPGRDAETGESVLKIRKLDLYMLENMFPQLGQATRINTQFGPIGAPKSYIRLFGVSLPTGLARQLTGVSLVPVDVSERERQLQSVERYERGAARRKLRQIGQP